MTTLKLGLAIVLSATIVCAQEIPPGTALPIALDSTLDARKVKSDQTISGTITQDVPLSANPQDSAGTKIRSGSHVVGRVLQTGRNSDGSSYIRIRFDRVQTKDGDIPVTTSLRALASPWEVQEAQLPKRTPVRGESPANWVTHQIGGDVVYRGGGHVMHGEEVVGDPVSGGVLAELKPVPRPGCETGSGNRKLALWLFSSTACGVYGFSDLQIAHAGDKPPVGDIVLQSTTIVLVPTGSGMLLVTVTGPRGAH